MRKSRYSLASHSKLKIYQISYIDVALKARQSLIHELTSQELKQTENKF